MPCERMSKQGSWFWMMKEFCIVTEVGDSKSIFVISFSPFLLVAVVDDSYYFDIIDAFFFCTGLFLVVS